MMSQPCDLSAVEARRLIARKQLSPVELAKSCLERIEAVNPVLNAIVTLDETRAMAEARAAEQAVMESKELGLLHGLPVAVKDLDDTAGLRTTYGSLVHESHVPERDSAMVHNVRAAGAIIFAKTNTPEFGAGANTTNRVFGATGNPFDPELTCAGSSGGSAVALATGMAALATGSDYGGSLRTPAAFCGVTGFRPSPGLVPKAESPVGLNPFSVLGPMGRTIADAHLLLLAQLDVDRRDPFSSTDADNIPQTLSGTDLGALRVACSRDLGCAPVDENIARTFDDRLSTFSHVFGEVLLRDPDMAGVHEAFEPLRGVNFVAAFGDLVRTQRDRLGPNVIDNTERGLAFSLQDVAKAHVTQTRIFRSFRRLFEEVDLLICPAASVSPFPHAQLYVTEINGERMENYMRWLALSYALTMALPCVAALPCGVDHKGMPFGIQLAAPMGNDALVLEAAYALEQELALKPETSRPMPAVVNGAT